MTNFRDKLKEIRTDQERRAKERVPLTDEELGLKDGVESCLAARDEVTRQVEDLMEDFIRETAGFSIRRGFFEGKYSISLYCDELCKDYRGEVDKCFSRITFLLAPCTTDNSFEVTSKLTILNQDLPKGYRRGVLPREGEEDLRSFREFVETEMLRFAKEYFTARRPSQPEEPVVGNAT